MGKDEDAMRIRDANTQKEIDLLQQILDAIKSGGPPTPPPAPGSFPSLADIQATIEAAFEDYGLLKRANDFYVKTIDLSTAVTTPTELTDLANAQSLTIFICTGTITLWLQKADATHQITISPLTYPQTLLIDWLDISKVFIQNTAQAGLQLVILKFFRDVE